MTQPEQLPSASEKTTYSRLVQGSKWFFPASYESWLSPSYAAMCVIASDFFQGLRWVVLKTAGVGSMLMLLLLLTVWQSTSLRSHLSDLVWLPENLRPAQWPVVVSLRDWLSERRDAFYQVAGLNDSAKSQVTGITAESSNDVVKNASGITAATVDPAANKNVELSTAEQNQRRAEAVGKYLSRRYRISSEATEALVDSAFRIGEEMKLDPLMLLAVMAIESGFNPFAQSWMGAQGLMQVMTGVHKEKFQIFGGERAAWNPLANMRVGARILKDCVTRGGSVAAGLKLYVGAGGLDNDQGYGVRVLAELRRLHDVAAGRVVPINPQPSAARAPASMDEKNSIDPLDEAPEGLGVVPGLTSPEAPGSSSSGVLQNSSSQTSATEFKQS